MWFANKCTKHSHAENIKNLQIVLDEFGNELQCKHNNRWTLVESLQNGMSLETNYNVNTTIVGLQQSHFKMGPKFYIKDILHRDCVMVEWNT